MITEDAKKILDTLAAFFNENEGNRINRWLAVPLINTIKADIQEILQRDSYVPPDNEDPSDDPVEEGVVIDEGPMDDGGE